VPFGYVFLLLFIFVFLVLFPATFLTAYTIRGRRLFLRLSGNKIIADFGIFSENNFFGFRQSLRLLKCERHQETFFVIEESERFTKQGGLSVYMLKISEESMKKFHQMLAEDK
jgi:hypothetical protein